MNFMGALKNMVIIDRTSKLSVMTATSRYPTIPQKVACTVTSLPLAQMTVERLFSSLGIIRSDLKKTYLRQFYFFLQMAFVGNNLQISLNYAE